MLHVGDRDCVNCIMAPTKRHVINDMYELKGVWKLADRHVMICMIEFISR
jgi:hypothetical protein